jgi:hypothetical protein
MIRFARRPAPDGPAPAPRPAAATGPRACPACGGGATRLVRKTLFHATRSASAVVVCDGCKHFWSEAAPR